MKIVEIRFDPTQATLNTFAHYQGPYALKVYDRWYPNEVVLVIETPRFVYQFGRSLDVYHQILFVSFYNLEEGGEKG